MYNETTEIYTDAHNLSLHDALPISETAAANAKEMVDPIRRCKPAEDGSITVCGTDTERHRLTPELRAIAGVGREAPPKLPRAEARAMSLDKLRSEEHTSELQSLMRISYAVFCLKKKNNTDTLT